MNSFNKEQFFTELANYITGNDFKYFVVNAEEVNSNLMDLMTSVSDLSSLTQKKIESFINKLEKIHYENKDIEMYVWCPEVNRDFDEPSMYSFLSIRLKKNKYSLKELQKYAYKCEDLLDKMIDVYHKYGV